MQDADIIGWRMDEVVDSVSRGRKVPRCAEIQRVKGGQTAASVELQRDAVVWRIERQILV
jgi:hypothetical protein